MPFTELESESPNLSRDKEHGLILEDGKRIISFKLATFQALVKRLVGLAGETVGRTLLFQMGNEIGRVGLRYSRDRILEDNNVKVLDAVIRLRGWGRCLGLERKEDKNSNVYVFTMSDCPLCYQLKETVPICDLMRGILTGWMEAFLDKKATRSIEMACATVEGPLCVFEVVFPGEDSAQLG